MKAPKVNFNDKKSFKTVWVQITTNTDAYPLCPPFGPKKSIVFECFVFLQSPWFHSEDCVNFAHNLGRCPYIKQRNDSVKSIEKRRIDAKSVHSAFLFNSLAILEPSHFFLRFSFLRESLLKTFQSSDFFGNNVAKDFKKLTSKKCLPAPPPHPRGFWALCGCSPLADSLCQLENKTLEYNCWPRAFPPPPSGPRGPPIARARK